MPVVKEGNLSNSSNECLLSEEDNELNEQKCPRQKPLNKSYFHVSKKNTGMYLNSLNPLLNNQTPSKPKQGHSKKSSDLIMDSLGNNSNANNKTQLPLNPKTHNITINSQSNNSPSVINRHMGPNTCINEMHSPPCRPFIQIDSNKINTSYSKIGDSNTFLNEEVEPPSSMNKQDTSNITTEREQFQEGRVRVMHSDMLYSVQQEQRMQLKLRSHFDNDKQNKISSFKSVRKLSGQKEEANNIHSVNSQSINKVYTAKTTQIMSKKKQSVISQVYRQSANIEQPEQTTDPQSIQKVQKIPASVNKRIMSLFSINKSTKLRTADKSKSTNNLRMTEQHEEGEVESGELDDCIEGSIPHLFSNINSLIQSP